MVLLLMLQLRRYSRMFLALFMAPFGLPGIVLAMLPGGTPMGFVALLGVIALAGMIIRNAVILIGEADSNLAQGMTNDAAIIAAAEHRARPICLTACAAILGMIPISHQVFWGPMAYAIIGGCWSRRWSHSRYCPRRSVCYYSGGTLYATGTTYKTRSIPPDPLRDHQRKMGSQDLSNILFRQLLCLCAICGDGLQHIAQQDLASFGVMLHDHSLLHKDGVRMG